MENISERIIKMAEHFGVSKASEFAKATGFSHQVASNYLKADKKPSVDALSQLQLSFDSVNPDWLITGRGSMLRSASISEPKGDVAVAHRKDDVSGREGIPLIPLEAVAGLMGNKGTVLEQDIQHLFTIPTFTDVSFMIAVSGSSMYPKYNSGDVVACRIIRDSKVIMWNRVYVLDTLENGVLIKRLRKGSSADTLIAVSDNKDYDPFDLPTSEIRMMALVIGVVRLE